MSTRTVMLLFACVLAGLLLAAPAMAADGQIAFVSLRDGNPEIYVMNADGSGEVRLTDNAADDLQPAWSPDGTMIAFVSTRDGDHKLFVMDADGTGVLQLTDFDAGSPAWSPDGTRIAFGAALDGGNGDLYTISPDGTGIARITTGGLGNYDPSWSPDGSRIAFVSLRDGDLQIYVMNADGTGQARLTTDGEGDVDPSWSPEGSLIAFTSWRDGPWGEVYVMNPDGTGQTRLTTNDVWDGAPSWSPDGSRIAFFSNRDGNNEIYVMNPDGTATTRLTTNDADDYFPAWWGGLWEPVTLSGHKFYDLAPFGTRDSGEPGLAGWPIILKKDGIVVAQMVTDDDGYYEFLISEPGSYTVEEDQGAAPWVQTTPAQPYAFDAVSGADLTVDFGNRLSQDGDSAGSIITSSDLCSFGDEFRLIFTPDPANAGRYMLSASNPGQFYYHVFDIAAAGDTYIITLPQAFVTQGAEPVHVYSALNAYPTACLETDEADDVTSQFAIDSSNPQAITVTSEGYTGFVWITVHFDFGWKKVSGYGRDAKDNAVLTGKTVNQGTDYRFVVSGGTSSSWTITNLNVFKKNPGFGGMVLQSDGTPKAGVKVEIYNQNGNLVGSAVSDADGYYMYSYKKTSKPSTFTLKLPDYGIVVQVPVKPNAFVVKDFTLP